MNVKRENERNMLFTYKLHTRKMSLMVKKIISIHKKIKSMCNNLSDPYWIAKKNYVKYYDELEIDEHCILLESQHGTEINGNIFYLLRYLSQNEDYNHYKIYVAARNSKINQFHNVLQFYKIENVRITVLSSDEYFRLLASAKYLINDNTFLPFFVKKEGQVYLNTWHGTPLKSLGKGIKNDAHAIGNAQKNFVSADYLLFPNEHTKEAIIHDYMIEDISSNSYIMGGYPRNEAFFCDERRNEIIDLLNLNNKKVYAYMPTYRGIAREGGTSKNTHYLNYYLHELDKSLRDDEILYVNLHPIAKKDIIFEQFRHIRSFPRDYETYDFLNVAEVLITDYSSVFFDYACTGRKIILFTYDEEEYLADRGTYMEMKDLPFPQVKDISALLNELRRGDYCDYQRFCGKFCKYENRFASQKLCDYVILGKETELEIHKMPDNGKENVLIYAGNLAGNGITASLRSLLSSIDLTKRNYYFSFYTERTAQYKDTIFTFPEQVRYYALTGDQNLSFSELLFRKLYRIKLIPVSLYLKFQKKRVKQGLERVIGCAKFDSLVHFSGYEEDVILAFSMFDGPRTIYVHSNMVQEIKVKGNARWDVLRYAYNNYDNVAVVTEDMIEPTLRISKKRENIKVVKNLVDYKTILSKAEKEIRLDSFTKSTRSEDEIREILNSSSECFINVGRFAPEKGHDRLVSAFYLYHQRHPQSYLFIMGGYSLYGGYEKLWNQIEQLGIQQNVILLEKVTNPYPILKACDYFVLSSHYEGFGLVLAEADILDVPVVSTDIPGPRGFMKKYGGILVEDSQEGILKGMELLHSGDIKPMNVDYQNYNREAIVEFEQILKRNQN